MSYLDDEPSKGDVILASEGNDVYISVTGEDSSTHYCVTAEEIIEMHEKCEVKTYTREEVEKLFIEYEIAHRDQGADREQWLKDNL